MLLFTHPFSQILSRIIIIYIRCLLHTVLHYVILGTVPRPWSEEECQAFELGVLPV